MPRTDKKPEQKIASKSSAKDVIQSDKFDDSESNILNQEQRQIIEWLKEVKFQKQLIGGLREEDVWKKIQQLNEMYMDALKAERIRYDVLLEEQNIRSRVDPHLVGLTKEM